MSERPRRTTRPTTKQPVLLSNKHGDDPEGGKKEEKKPAKQSEKLFDIEYLLTDPKSHLTRLDMSVRLILKLLQQFFDFT